MPLGRWDERKCDAAFIQLVGQEGVGEARLKEILPARPSRRSNLRWTKSSTSWKGAALRPYRHGRKRLGENAFEWQKHSLFLMPRGLTHDFTNAG